MRYAARLQTGSRAWQLTKLDVLTGMPRVKVCVGYEIEGERRDEVPMSLSEFEAIRPITRRRRGGRRTFLTRGYTAIFRRPRKKYIRMLEEINHTWMSPRVRGGRPERDDHREKTPSGLDTCGSLYLK
jgi:adenylosuccinate synthase